MKTLRGHESGSLPMHDHLSEFSLHAVQSSAGRPLNILHIMQSAQIGGAERSLLTLLPALRRAGHHVEFLGFADRLPSRFADALRAKDVPVHVLGTRKLFGLSVMRQLRAEIKRRRPDVIHTHLVYADFQAHIAAMGLGIPGVRTVHGPGNIASVWKDRTASRVAGLLADRTITVSEHVERLVRERRHAPAGRIANVTHGVEMSPRRDARQARDTIGLNTSAAVIVCTSRLVEGKGHDVLLRAMAGVTRRVEAHLLIVGSGPLTEGLARTAKTLLPEGTYTFAGFREDIAPALAAADIFVLPTEEGLGEGSPLAVLEAMAAGLPVVASNLAGLRDIIVPGESGVLVEPGNPDALADALVELIASPDRRAELGRRGAAVVHDRFSVEHVVEETIRVYREVV